MSLVIKNGHVIDPASGTSERLDVLLDGASVAEIGAGLEGDETIDASGLVVCPGLVDLHVHFREPGQESKETIATGSRAAAHGGFTSVVTMANTDPPIDNAGTLELVIRRAKDTSCIKIWPSACATKQRAGKEMTEMAELKSVGAVAVTDDGDDIVSSWVMRRVLEYADMCGLTYIAHCEDKSLCDDGIMNEGYVSTRLGLPGIPKAMEEIMVERNIRLAGVAGARIHIAHISTADSVDIVRRAKARGVKVTCETAPHYWTLTDEALEGFDTNAKMNPPLREAVDVAAIKEGLADGTIDCIATDHAPHAFTEKDVEIPLAPFGIVGLETSLALTISELVEPGVITLERAVELMSWAPAQVLDLPVGYLKKGGPADVTLFDPKAEWTVCPELFHSRSHNTPFARRVVRGQVKATICCGQIIYQSE
ncbi:MAG: amidohydrolase family protein [Nitrospiraceae bacterium]|nr:amidohydrolase family protein [Nitrospiraceae bacterium]